MTPGGVAEALNKTHANPIALVLGLAVLGVGGITGWFEAFVIGFFGGLVGLFAFASFILLLSEIFPT
jgi:hypothetical protein